MRGHYPTNLVLSGCSKRSRRTGDYLSVACIDLSCDPDQENLPTVLVGPLGFWFVRCGLNIVHAPQDNDVGGVLNLPSASGRADAVLIFRTDYDIDHDMFGSD